MSTINSFELNKKKKISDGAKVLIGISIIAFFGILKSCQGVDYDAKLEAYNQRVESAELDVTLAKGYLDRAAKEAQACLKSRMFTGKTCEDEIKSVDAAKDFVYTMESNYDKVISSYTPN